MPLSIPNTFQPGKILVVQTALIGDVILLTPLIDALKKLYPEAEIDVLVNRNYASVLHNNPSIHSILTISKKKPEKLASLASVFSQIRARKYGLAISAHRSFTTAHMLLLAEIRYRIGFGAGLSGRFYNIRVPWQKGMRRVDKNLSLLHPLTDRKFPIQAKLYPSSEDTRFAINLVEENNQQRFIALAPGSMSFTKRWPTDYYSNLAKRLGDSGFKLIFLGSKSEREDCEEIIEEAGIEAINLAGNTSILRAASVISVCDLLVCNDSGLMHVANAMGTPVVTFFGPTVASLGYTPYGKNDKIFEIDLDCRPCGKHGGKSCPLGHHKCMREIEPETVFPYIMEHYGTQ